jgi:hypothetical protein
MSMFAKLATAKMTSGGTNVRDGKYRFMVENVIARENHKKEEQVIAELRVISSEAVDEVAIGPDGWPYADGRKAVPNAPGSSCSIVWSFKHESAPGAAKAFILNVLAPFGYTEAKITEQVMEQSCDQNAKPLRGMVVDAQTYRTANQGRSNSSNKGKPLVLFKWSPIPQTKEDRKKGRDFLAGNKATVDPNTAPVEGEAQPAAQPVAQPAAQPVEAVQTQTVSLAEALGD